MLKIKEKLFKKITKDDTEYFCYAPDIRGNDEDMGFSAGFNCWLFKKPIDVATIDDYVECVDPIMVWFSDFQIYKHILSKMYGFDAFKNLSNKRWDFLDSNKNRYKLLYTLIGDYGCMYTQFEVLCYDTLKDEYVLMSLNDREKNIIFEIRKCTSLLTDTDKIYEHVKQSTLVERFDFERSRNKTDYSSITSEYKPLFKFFDFVQSFYSRFILDGNLISLFTPLDGRKILLSQKNI